MSRGNQLGWNIYADAANVFSFVFGSNPGWASVQSGQTNAGPSLPHCWRTEPFNLTQWYHIMLTRDGSTVQALTCACLVLTTSQTYCYVDGQSVGTTTTWSSSHSGDAAIGVGNSNAPSR